MKNINEEDILRILAKSWNNLNIQNLIEVLDRNIIYQSQWVPNPIIGKSALHKHLEVKYTAIKKDLHKGKMFVIAEMAYFPNLKDKPCLIITQKTGRITRQVSVLISIENGLIKRINVC